MIKEYTKEDYINLIGKAIEKVLGDKCLIIFFGSVLNERFNKTSDIDVAVFCNKDLSAKKFMEIQDEIEKLPILKEVDIIDLRKVKNVEFIENTMKGKVWKNIPELWEDLENHLKSLKK